MSERKLLHHFHKFLKTRQEQIVHAVDNVIRALAGSDAQEKQRGASSIYKAAVSLSEGLEQEAHPPWLPEIIKQSKYFIDNAQANPAVAIEFITALVALRNKIDHYDWNWHDVEVPDFSSIYAHFYAESRLQELFDRLVSELQQVMASGQLNNLRTLRALEDLVDIIKRNARGDYLSSHGAIRVAKVFLKKLAIETAKSVPVLKQLVSAAEQTLDEIGVELVHVKKKTRDRISEATEVDLPLLIEEDAPKQLTHDPNDSPST